MDLLAPDAPIAKIEMEADGRIEEVWPLARDRDFLVALFTELFERHWEQLTWGPLIPGAAYELKCPGKPESIRFSDFGYLTVHWGSRGHFHLCLGAGPTMEPGLARRRSPSRVELVRRLDARGHPLSWSLRMANGADEPMITLFLPSPFLLPEDRIADTPDWSRLALWEELFPRLTGHAPDGRDRLGQGYSRN